MSENEKFPGTDYLTITLGGQFSSPGQFEERYRFLRGHRLSAATQTDFKDVGLTNGRTCTYRVVGEDLAKQTGPFSSSLESTPSSGAVWGRVPSDLC
jgi:hypothetical protein